MKKLTMVVGATLSVVSGLGMPLSVQAAPRDVEPLFKPEQSLPKDSAQASRKMSIYSDCIQTHANVNGAEFKQVNKFCSCVADQSLQGAESSLSTCATGDGGGTLGMIGEIAPTVIMGVVEELTTRSSSRSDRSGGLLEKGGGLLDGLGGLFGSGGFNLKDLNLKDILKNRL